ncbi:MAG: hypothetical protein EOP14_00190 [Pseudomonas sp.]|nr:MAG: hypothetical protein EOP14_00190 [Pseudomonas sp.]
MPDINLSAGGNRSIKYKDMGDGTQAEVVYIGGGSTGASSALPAGTDRSGTITTGGTAQTLAPSNASRVSLTGQNISTGDLWINEIGGTAAVNGTGSYKIASGQAFSIGTNRAISIVGATTGQQFTATET